MFGALRTEAEIKRQIKREIERARRLQRQALIDKMVREWIKRTYG